MRTATRHRQFQLGDRLGATTVVRVHERGRRRLLNIERRDDDHRVFADSVWAGQVDKATAAILDRVEFTAPLHIEHPGWLFARGNDRCVQVMRTPLLKTERPGGMYAPVREWITAHGLVLADLETVGDEDWMYGQYESSVYVS